MKDILAVDLVLRREIALAALVDIRTFDRALAGLDVRPMTLERIRRALAARGMTSLLPSKNANARAALRAGAA